MKYYNQYWKDQGRTHSFWEYERNWALPGLFTKKERILDLACGDGAVSLYLQEELGQEVVAADFSEKALKTAKKRGLKAVKVDVEKKFPFKSGSFDTVFWGDNVEHLFDPMKTLREIKRVLGKKGRLILSFPNMGYWRYRLNYLKFGSLPDTEWSGNPPWKWLHIRFFNATIIKDLLRKEGFKVRRIEGISRRFPDRLILPRFSTIFGMILVVEALKV